MIHNAWSSIEEVPYCLSWSNFKVSWDENLTIWLWFEHFQMVTRIWIHEWLWNDTHSFHGHEEVLHCFFNFISQISRSQGLKNRQFGSDLDKITWPVAAIKSLKFAFFFVRIKNGYLYGKNTGHNKLRHVSVKYESVKMCMALVWPLINTQTPFHLHLTLKDTYRGFQMSSSRARNLLHRERHISCKSMNLNGNVCKDIPIFPFKLQRESESLHAAVLGCHQLGSTDFRVQPS